MSAATKLLAVLVTAALLVVLGALSRVPIEGENAGSAALRLTWRVRGEEVGECRRPTPEELAELPVHMQNPDACVGSLPPYRLTAEVDDSMYADVVIEPAGARGDRPLYVYREILLEPGRHAVRVRFVREDGASADRAESEFGNLEFEGTVSLEPGQILLLTRDPDGGALEVREPVG